MPTDTIPTWEETTAIEPLWEETTPLEEPVALEPPDMVVQPQTGVVQSAAPGSIAPTDLKPSVRLIGGEQVTGQIGDTHPDIIKRERIPAVDIDQRGFQGPGGEFFPRESAAIATGLPTEREPTRLHSTDLIKKPDEVGKLLIPPTGELSTTYGGPPKSLASVEETMVEPVEELTTPRFTTPKFKVNEEDSIALAAGKEAANIISSVPEFLSSNLGLMSLVSGGAAPTATAAVFTLDMLKSLGNQVVGTYKDWDKMTRNQKVAALTDIAGTGAMAALAAHGTARGIRRGITPVEEITPKSTDISIEPKKPVEVPPELGEMKSTEDAQKVGLESKSIERLDQLAQDRRNREAKQNELMDQAKSETDPSKQMQLLNEVSQLRVQLPREAIETATNVGSAVEGESITSPASKLGKRPLDWRENPEVADWLKQNGESLGIRLPPELKPAVPELAMQAGIVSGIRGKPMAEESMWYWLDKRFGIKQGGRVSVVFKPEAEHAGMFIFDKTTGKPVGIEINRANVPSQGTLNWVMEHEAAHWFDLEQPGGAAKMLIDTVKPAEWSRIESDIVKLGYKVQSAATERTARGIQTLADSWKNRGWFQKMVGNVQRFANEVIGFKMTRKAAESAAVRAIAQSIEKAKAPTTSVIPSPERGLPESATESDLISDMSESGRKFFNAVKSTKDEFTGINATSLTPSDRRNLARLGVSFSVDRSGKIIGTWPSRKRVELLRQKVKEGSVLEVQEAKALPSTAPIGEAAEQLTERLKAAPPVGTREKLSLREAIADAWSQGKAIFDRSRAKAQAVTETIKDAAKGAREPSELDKRVGELDWLLQRAAGQSRDMGKTMRKQVRDANLRRAAAIWIDTPGDAATKTSTIRTALSDLQLNPELWRKTPNEVKRAMETAANMPAEGIQFAESLREYYARRNQDAVDHSLFEHGLEDYFTHVWGNEKNMPDELRGAIGGGRVQTYWQFSRQRKLGTFLDGIMRGKIPQLDPANVLPFYNYTLDRAIASRSFIKNITDNMVASDGRAVVAPTGTLSKVPQGQPTEASLVRPKGKTGEIADYKTINHPALRKWKWMANDENGKPILSQNDLVVHPEHYERLARMMDMSRLKGSRVSEALLRASTEVKGFKLGLLSAFHQVHVGSHALFHWTLPFNFKDPRFFTPEGDIRWNSPDVRFAIEKGHLKIAPDARELKIFAEGLLSPGLIHKIPVVGPWSRAYSEWTFGEYIPKLKLKTFAAAMPRNLRWYRGKLSEDAIAARVGDAVNNAYGELNNLFLGKIGRNPATQRMLRGIFLAPDFGEARLRFVGKGLTSYGTEERLALATMFITLYTAARVGNWLSHGDPELDPKRAFQVKSGKHWWSMRSVIGDLDRAFLDTSRFFYVRLNPLYSRTAADWLFGRDINGRKLTPMEKIVKRPLNQLVPIQFQALTRDDQALWESLIGAMGLGAVSDTPQQDVYRLVDNWMKNSDDPKLQAAFKRREAEVFPPSDYTKLRYALRHDDEQGARKAYEELLKTRKPATITDAMLPGKPFTGSFPNELKFRNSLTDAQKKIYDQARQEQKEMYSKFQIIRRSPEPAEKEPTWEETVPVTE